MQTVCPLCGFLASLEGEAWGRQFYLCGCCDLVFVPASQHLSPSDEKARYAQHNNSIENIGYVQMFTRKLKVLHRTWQGVRRVLDFGCGPGPVLVELLQRMGYDAHGYDPFFAPNADLSQLFDAVVSTETFEHFAAPAKELKRIVGLIRPEGYVAVMTQFRPEDRPVTEWWYAREPTHVSFYSRATRRWIAAQYNLEEVYADDKDFVVWRMVRTP